MNQEGKTKKNRKIRNFNCRKSGKYDVKQIGWCMVGVVGPAGEDGGHVGGHGHDEPGGADGHAGQQARLLRTVH